MSIELVIRRGRNDLDTTSTRGCKQRLQRFHSSSRELHHLVELVDEQNDFSTLILRETLSLIEQSLEACCHLFRIRQVSDHLRHVDFQVDAIWIILHTRLHQHRVVRDNMASTHLVQVCLRVDHDARHLDLTISLDHLSDHIAARFQRPLQLMHVCFDSPHVVTMAMRCTLLQRSNDLLTIMNRAGEVHQRNTTLLFRLHKRAGQRRMVHQLSGLDMLTRHRVQKHRSRAVITHAHPTSLRLDSLEHSIRCIIWHTHVTSALNAHTPSKQSTEHIRIQRQNTTLSHKCSRCRKLPCRETIRAVQTSIHDLSQRHRLPHRVLLSERTNVPQVLIVATHTVASVHHHNVLTLHALREHTRHGHRLTVLIKDTIAHLEQTDADISALIGNRYQLIIRMSLTGARWSQQDHVTHLRTSQGAHERDLLVLSPHDVTSGRRKLRRKVSKHRVLIIQTIIIEQIVPPFLLCQSIRLVHQSF